MLYERILIRQLTNDEKENFLVFMLQHLKNGNLNNIIKEIEEIKSITTERVKIQNSILKIINKIN